MKRLCAPVRTSLSALALLMALSVQAKEPPAPKLGDRLPQQTKAAAASSYRVIDWGQMLPKDWNPMKAFEGLNFAGLSDADPRAAEAMKKIQEAWNDAPTEPTLNDQRVRIAGFVVPLDGGKDGLQELLLVPYYGACVHSPPPPANQIIHVRSSTPLKGVRMMDAIWINGTLKTEKSETTEGISGYTMVADSFAPYQWPTQRR
ncbi:DUF3299 domain-containing protein [Roseateles sp.]|uniref:DUF3299 domain-containing protein n=1 Tax=Roseateles sp. TaxID=1971397 RepID=UPI003BA79BF1